MDGFGLSVSEYDLEFRAAAHRSEIDQPRVGLRVFAVGDDAAILDLADEGLHHGMVDAHHRKTVERHVLDKIAKRVLHGVEGLKWSRCSGSTLVTIATSAGNFKNGPSLSSASTTIHSPAPNLPLVP